MRTAWETRGDPLYGCQWMTAGSGILHKEMPQPSERLLRVPVVGKPARYEKDGATYI